MPDEAHLAAALERSGTRVVRVDQERHRPSDPSVECALFTGHPGSFGRMEEWRATHPTVLWAPRLVPGFPEFDPVLEAARKASLFMSGDRYDWKGAWGIERHLYLPAGCDPGPPGPPKPPEVPCAFVGSIYNARRQRIARLVRKFGGVVLDRMSRWLYGPEFARFVQSVKVVVGDNARNDIPGCWSPRTYAIPGAGGFLLAPQVPGLERDFVLHRELAVYSGEEELEFKMRQWISDDPAREAVRAAGQERVRRDHTWGSRVKTLIAIAGSV